MLTCMTTSLSKTQKILAWIPAVLVGLFMLGASAAPKLFMSYEGSPLQASVEPLGVWNILFWIGVLELVCAVLLLIPRTFTIGFVLNVGLLGGAMATTLTHPEAEGAWWWFPLILLLLITLSAYWIAPELLDRLFKRPVPVVGKARRIMGWVVSMFVALFFLFSAVMKFVPQPEGSPGYEFAKALGMQGLEHPLGILQFIIFILFVVPRTCTVGFILMIGYWGGVIAANLSHGFGGAEAMPLYVSLGLLTLGAYGRNPELLSRLLGRKA